MAFQGDSIYWVEVDKVVPNPFQPRREFDQSKLQELSESIRMYGVLQPLTVTRKEVQREDGTFYTEYELIAGERRLRASRLAKVAQVPVIIREGEQSEQEKLELAIIENLQREDLNSVDRAIAFKQLSQQFKMSHGQVAKKMGRSREYVSNSIRLLGLPEHMLDSLRRGDMMEGHARTLLMLTDRPEEQEVVFKETLLKKLSVREVERIVRKIATDKVRKKGLGEFDASLIDLEKRFTETLGTRVQIQKTDFGGKLTIDYFSEDDLEVLFKRIKDEVSEKKPVLSEVVTKLTEHIGLESVVTPAMKEVSEIVSAAKSPTAPVSTPAVVPIETPVTPPVSPVTSPVVSSFVKPAVMLAKPVTSLLSPVVEKVVNETEFVQKASLPEVVAPVSPSVDSAQLENDSAVPVAPVKIESTSPAVSSSSELTVIPLAPIPEKPVEKKEKTLHHSTSVTYLAKETILPPAPLDIVSPAKTIMIPTGPTSIVSPAAPVVPVVNSVLTELESIPAPTPVVSDFVNKQPAAVEKTPTVAEVPKLPESEPAPAAAESEDDAGLYSMSNFTV